MEEFYNKHYLTVDAGGRILDGWSDGPHPNRDASDAVLRTDLGGYQFRLFDGGAENPVLRTEDGIPLYIWKDEEVFRRTEAEIEADREALPEPEPAPTGDLEAQVADLGAAMMLLLEGLT